MPFVTKLVSRVKNVYLLYNIQHSNFFSKSPVSEEKSNH